MACGSCGGAAKNVRKYDVKHPGGRVTTANSLGEAIALSKRVGGTYKPKR